MNKPLNPELTFQHISVHMIHILARLQAKRLVQEQLRRDQAISRLAKGGARAGHGISARSSRDLERGNREGASVG
jgi:hypothetical protein